MYRPALLAPSLDAARFRRTSRQSLLFGLLLYGVGTAAAFLSPWLALAVFGFGLGYFIFFSTHPASEGLPLASVHE